MIGARGVFSEALASTTRLALTPSTTLPSSPQVLYGSDLDTGAVGSGFPWTRGAMAAPGKPAAEQVNFTFFIYNRKVARSTEIISQTDKHSDRPTDESIGGHSDDGQAQRRTDRQSSIWTDRLTYRPPRRVLGRPRHAAAAAAEQGRRVDRQTNKQTDVSTDRLTDIPTDLARS